MPPQDRLLHSPYIYNYRNLGLQYKSSTAPQLKFGLEFYTHFK